MGEKHQKTLLEKTDQDKLSKATAKQFMNSDYTVLKINYTLKGTIEIFRLHHISGAPVIDYQEKIVGVITEYDLLIQAASKPLSDSIDFNPKIISVYPETTLKEVLITLYKYKLKWMPVVNKEKYIQGVVSRIDVLDFVASNSDK